jgi:hypothetical protein
MKNSIGVNPVKTYEAPNVPTFNETRKDSEFLKTLPLRWKKNAAVITAIGLMGTFVFAGCAEQTASYPVDDDIPFIYTGYTEDELIFRLQVGGAGGAAYVVHFTEQEALGIIRMQLEMAGLRFDAEPPNYIADSDESGRGTNTSLDLFDEKRSVAIAYLNWDNSNKAFRERGQRIADEIAQDFEKQDKNITFGVFHTPGVYQQDMIYYQWDEDGNFISYFEPTDDEIEQAKINSRPELEERLNEQINSFIEFLQREGII